jgi:hypothetical protein
MELNESQIAKVNPLLKDALIHTREDERMQVILELQKPFVKDPFNPQDFPKYEDYRQAFLNYRQQEYAALLGETIQALEKLGLEIPASGTNNLSLIARGLPKQIAGALELSAIKSVR